MDVRERLLQLMDERGWTIYRVAKEAGIPWSTIRNMFKRSTDPSISTLESICQALGISLAEFFAPTPTSEPLTPRQQLLLREWSRLNDTQQTLLLSFLAAFHDS